MPPVHPLAEVHHLIGESSSCDMLSARAKEAEDTAKNTCLHEILQAALVDAKVPLDRCGRLLVKQLTKQKRREESTST
jgi:hypothetical protein